MGKQVNGEYSSVPLLKPCIGVDEFLYSNWCILLTWQQAYSRTSLHQENPQVPDLSVSRRVTNSTYRGADTDADADPTVQAGDKHMTCEVYGAEELSSPSRYSAYTYCDVDQPC